MQKNRNSTIELLRIISIFLILLYHYGSNGGVINNPDQSYNSYLLSVTSCFGGFGVNIFIIITGYFLTYTIDKVKIYKRLIPLYVTVWTVSVMCILFAYFVMPDLFREKAIIKSFFPVIYGKWWFVTGYFEMLLLAPFVNVMGNALSKKDFQILILIMVVIYSVIPSVFIKSKMPFSGNFFTFLMFYVVGSYIRRYIDVNRIKYLKYYTLVSVMTIPITVILIKYLTQYFPFGVSNQLFYAKSNSVFVLCASVCVVLCFVKMKEFHNVVINNISKTVLGIYLLTESRYTREWIWLHVVDTKQQYSEPYLLFHILLSVSCIFLAAAAIEFIRSRIVALCISGVGHIAGNKR